MHIYVHEPRGERRPGLLAELKSEKMIPRLIEDVFFEGDLGLLNRPGVCGSPFLLAAVPGVSDRIAALRRAGCENPVVVLRDGRNSREAAASLNGGADEDLVAPLKAIELKARLNAILRRANGHAGDEVKVGDVVAYFDGRDPQIAGRRVRLSSREHAIFHQLVLNARRVVSKAAIYDAVYGIAEVPPFEKVIDVYICKIRKKLEASTPLGARYIETVPGRGYRLSEEAFLTEAAD
ncbi:response regulator transcription factor [Roseibacterium sp. SDUM158017]|uniref:response regulator transcription factor n=1 Tax=Roseicyclus salinarum TaxID=3036773 RepID=UPI002414F84B|nr:response regulator transcription factor [Roseibacterium sp. SDUM158017]MDG4648646.1 response regulator transcription factor [Roseibacterium sp. SDUM158017]